MRKLSAVAAAAVLALGGMTGCGLFEVKPTVGTVIEKDYDPTTADEWENWDITVRTPEGTDVELDVSERVYKGCSVAPEANSYYDGSKCTTAPAPAVTTTR
jgi:hypothetical protein